MNAYKPAAAYHRYIKYQIIDLIIITQKYTQKYQPLVIDMVKSGKNHLENKTFILSVKYVTVPYFVKRVATLSLNIAVTLHNLPCYVIIMENYGKLITVFVRKKHSSQRARRPKLFHILLKSEVYKHLCWSN